MKLYRLTKKPEEKIKRELKKFIKTMTIEYIEDELGIIEPEIFYNVDELDKVTKAVLSNLKEIDKRKLREYISEKIRNTAGQTTWLRPDYLKKIVSEYLDTVK